MRLLPKPFGLNVFQQLQIRLNIRHELFALNVLHVDFEKSSFLVFLEHGGYLLGQIIVRGLIKVLHIGQDASFVYWHLVALLNPGLDALK